MEQKKFEYIDSLRGIAILLVILVHTLSCMAAENSYFSGPVRAFIVNGQLGVQLFFIVSAFTLMLSYQNRYNEKNRTTNFFIRRFFRIAPMYYLAIIFILLDNHFGLNTYKVQHEQYTLLEIVTNFLFINGWIPEYINRLVPGGWSITVEFTFYMILPFLCSKIKSLNASIILVVASLLFSTVFRMIMEVMIGDKGAHFLTLNFISQLPVFSLGILAYWILNDKRKIESYSLLFVALAVFVYSYKVVPYHFFYSLVFFLILLALTQKPYQLLSNKILASIGKVSYSMYLIHFIFICLLIKYNNFNIFSQVSGVGMALCKFVVIYGIIFACSYTVSRFTYKYIEEKGQNVGRTLIKKISEN